MINHTGYGLSETFLNNPSSSVFGHALASLAIFGATVTVYVFSILFFFKTSKTPILILITGNITPNVFILVMISVPLRLNPTISMLSKMN